MQLPQREAIRIWNGIVQASTSESSIAAIGSGKKSWADEVEEEEASEKKQKIDLGGF